jgi:peptidoglycan/LPS O-acetylase OafA/YrhL
MSETTLQTTRISARTPVAAVLGATAAATAIWVVATAAGADLTVSFGPGQPIQKITVVNVVVAALVGSLAGWGLLALLRRFTAKARSVWTVTAIVAALLSLAGPLWTTASAGTKAWLVAMHLAVATVLIAVLRRTTPQHTG